MNYRGLVVVIIFRDVVPVDFDAIVVKMKGYPSESDNLTSYFKSIKSSFNATYLLLRWVSYEEISEIGISDRMHYLMLVKATEYRSSLESIDFPSGKLRHELRSIHEKQDSKLCPKLLCFFSKLPENLNQITQSGFVTHQEGVLDCQDTGVSQSYYEEDSNLEKNIVRVHQAYNDLPCNQLIYFTHSSLYCWSPFLKEKVNMLQEILILQIVHKLYMPPIQKSANTFVQVLDTIANYVRIYTEDNDSFGLRIELQERVSSIWTRMHRSLLCSSDPGISNFGTIVGFKKYIQKLLSLRQDVVGFILIFRDVDVALFENELREYVKKCSCVMATIRLLSSQETVSCECSIVLEDQNSITCNDLFYFFELIMLSDEVQLKYEQPIELSPSPQSSLESSVSQSLKASPSFGNYSNSQIDSQSFGGISEAVTLSRNSTRSIYRLPPEISGRDMGIGMRNRLYAGKPFYIKESEAGKFDEITERERVLIPDGSRNLSDFSTFSEAPVIDSRSTLGQSVFRERIRQSRRDCSSGPLSVFLNYREMKPNAFVDHLNTSYLPRRTLQLSVLVHDTAPISPAAISPASAWYPMKIASYAPIFDLPRLKPHAFPLVDTSGKPFVFEYPQTKSWGVLQTLKTTSDLDVESQLNDASDC